MDEDDKKTAIGYELGSPLDNLSVNELREVLAALHEEAARVEAEIGKKGQSRADADSFFKL
ncbi:MAG: DUF1192 domain-containing protein [Hyphomicrobiaceae bacterium]|nr:DUF1192 domain-containing protein [Hyphomicrobiaceae bacterium]MCC0024141.1 DUF1192 domain-containing protein [Hyphomicrobiaceae bacterium]